MNRIARSAVICAAAFGLAAGTAGAAVMPLSVSQFRTPTSGSVPNGIVLGPDGNLWFTESAANSVARITPGGQITELPIRGASSSPGAITTLGGNLWFVQTALNEIGEIATSGGAVTEVPTNVAGTCSAVTPTGPLGLTPGPNGQLWVTETGATPGAVAEVNPTTDTVTQQVCLLSGSPSGIAPGTTADGNVWAAVDASGTDFIDRITPGGSVSPLQLTNAAATTLPVVLGPDGSLYIGVSGSSPSLIKFQLNALQSAFPLPTNPAPNANVLAVGPDGDLWLAGGGALIQVTTGGAAQEYQGIYPPGDQINAIAQGPNNTLWLTDSTSSSIYRISLGAPAIAAALGPVAAVTTTSATVSGQVSVPSGELGQGFAYHFDYGPTTGYGSSTPAQTATASPSGATVTAALSGLAPNTTYHYRLVTAGCAPIGCSATTGDQSFTTGLSVTPAQGSTVGVVPVGGTVLLKLSGKRKFARLTTGELVAVGSTIDARKGQVLIESAVASVSQQVASGLFNGGIFTVTQPAGATTTVLKLDSSYKRCAARSKHRKHSARIASAKRKPSTHKVVNQVFGTAHGQYTTRGHYAAAADEGTSWQLADRCDGTYVAVSVGQVDVTNLVTGNSFPLNVGQHYLAKPH